MPQAPIAAMSVCLTIAVSLLPACPADISKVQDDEVGDGTTSVVVFAGELLREAELLVNQKVHPMTIIAGEARGWAGCLTGRSADVGG